MVSKDGPNGELCFEVVLERTITQEQRVGCTVKTEAEAKRIVKDLDRLDNDAAWHTTDRGKPKISEVINKGPLVYRLREFGGKKNMKSTGRPVA